MVSTPSDHPQASPGPPHAPLSPQARAAFFGRYRLVLFQARRQSDPMLHHEVRCFARHMGVETGALEVFDLLSRETAEAEDLICDPSVVLFIGGSGEYSVSQGGPRPLLDFIDRVAPRLVDLQRPTIGSCWGLHALAAGCGGRVARNGQAEVGTHPVRLSASAQRDPLFTGLPTHFEAQMGHKDWVLSLPSDALPLCENDLSPYQAVRFGQGPVYGLQFHPELDEHANRERFNHYISLYGRSDADEELVARFAPSPVANSLLRRFLDQLARQVLDPDAALDASPPSP